MAEVLPRDVLLRIGGRTLHRTGCLAAMGAGRGYVEVKETFARADGGTPLATFTDRDGSMRIAAADKVRIDYPPALSGLVDQFGYPYCGPNVEGTRQQLIQNSDYEVDIVGSVVKGGSTLVRDNAHALRGSWALKMTVANAGNSGVSFTKRDGSRMAGVAGTTYAGSAWVYATGAAVGGNLRVFVDWFDAGSVYLSTSNAGPAITLVQGWQRIGGVGALAPVNAVTAGPYLVTNSATGIWDVWVDVPQWEVGVFSSSAIPTGTVELTRASDTLIVPWNYGPMDVTGVYRFYRPPWADAVGDIGTFPEMANVADAHDPNARLEMYFQSATRQFAARSRDAGSQASRNIPAGAVLEFVSQHKNLTTLPAAATDVGDGAGLTAFDTGAAAMSSYFSQVLRVGGLGSAAMFTVLFDVMFLRGLRSRAEALAFP